MKIKEARQMYTPVINDLWERKLGLLRQQKENEKRGDTEANEAVQLELSKVSEQYDKVADYMEQLLAYQTCVHNSLVAKQQGEALQDAAKEQAKCMEIARRIAQGAKVPPQDEQRLMRFSPEMYMAAKEAALMNERKSDKEYDSLWDDEDENAPRDVGVEEAVDNTEFRAEAPAVSDISAGESAGPAE